MALAGPEVAELLEDIVARQARDAPVLHQSFAVRQMTDAAGADPVGFLAMRDDVGHRRMIGRKPVRGVVARIDFGDGERAITARERARRVVRIRRQPAGPIAWISTLTLALHRVVTGRRRIRDVSVRPERDRRHLRVYNDRAAAQCQDEYSSESHFQGRQSSVRFYRLPATGCRKAVVGSRKPRAGRMIDDQEIYSRIGEEGFTRLIAAFYR